MTRLPQSLPLLFLIGALWLGACRAAPAPDALLLPTEMPLAQLPTATSAPNLPPTRDLAASAPTPLPTAPTATRPPTVTPTPLAVWVRLSTPAEGTALLQGGEVVARGLVQRAAEQSVWLALVSATGRPLAEAQARLGESSWQASLVVPDVVSGDAFLEVTVRDAAGEPLASDRTRVELTLDVATAGRFLWLQQPESGETAVAGFNLLFAGQTLLPAGNVITVEIWENCAERVAQQSFVMGRSSRSFPWQGFVVAPEALVGPACAVARAGEPGTEQWREAQRLINVLPQDDPAANGVRLGAPPANSLVVAGESLLLYGTALNVREGVVQVTVVLDNGRTLAQASTTTDYWGYWETAVTLPGDISGPAQITISGGDPDRNNYAETTTLIQIEPAPTPTTPGEP